MIPIYVITLLSSSLVLLLSPYIVATQYELYSTTPVHHVTDRCKHLGSSIRWGVITVICTVIFLYSAWGIKDSIFSYYGYLC